VAMYIYQCTSCEAWFKLDSGIAGNEKWCPKCNMRNKYGWLMLVRKDETAQPKGGE